VVQDGIVEGNSTLAALILIGPAHDLGPLIPEHLVVLTTIEEILLGFFLAMT